MDIDTTREIINRAAKENPQFANRQHSATAIFAKNSEMVGLIPNLSVQTRQQFLKKLDEYMYVDCLNELIPGRYIRWVYITTTTAAPSLTNTGIYTRQQISADGQHIVIQCTNAMHRYYSFTFDSCLVFQKMSSDELLLASVLACYFGEISGDNHDDAYCIEDDNKTATAATANIV